MRDPARHRLMTQFGGPLCRLPLGNAHLRPSSSWLRPEAALLRQLSLWAHLAQRPTLLCWLWACVVNPNQDAKTERDTETLKRNRERKKRRHWREASHLTANTAMSTAWQVFFRQAVSHRDSSPFHELTDRNEAIVYQHIIRGHVLARKRTIHRQLR